MLMALIRNETLKLFRRKRFAVVMGILIAIISLVTYSQQRMLRNRRPEWRVQMQQRVAGMQNQLRRVGRTDSAWARSLRAEVNRLQFYIDHDIWWRGRGAKARLVMTSLSAAFDSAAEACAAS